MALPDQTPRLLKWPFLLGDAVLIAAAWTIVDLAPRPLDGSTVAAVVACGVAAAIAGAIPFLSDYARRQDEALDERQRSLESLGRTIETAAEQIGIVVTGFQEITALSQRNLKQADQLANSIRDEIAGLKARLGEFDAKIAALKSAAARVSAPSLPKPPREAPAPASPPPDAPTSPPAPDKAPAAHGPDAPAPADQPPPVRDASLPEPPPPIPIAAVEAQAPKAPPKKRPQRKPPEQQEPALPLAEPAPEVSDFSQIQPEEASEPAVSADGATRLLVTAYIGIGNRLFIRGDGPGLNWSKGMPLQFVSIGKWSWETADTAAPVKFKLYKNDEHECSSVGLRQLEPGRQLEITASFDRLS